MPSYSQEKSFIEMIMPRSILDEAIEWMAKNLEPDDVFSESDLEAWAEANDYVKKGGE